MAKLYLNSGNLISDQVLEDLELGPQRLKNGVCYIESTHGFLAVWEIS